jgi:hypothetical protein
MSLHEPDVNLPGRLSVCRNQCLLIRNKQLEYPDSRQHLRYNVSRNIKGGPYAATQLLVCLKSRCSVVSCDLVATGNRLVSYD